MEKIQKSKIFQKYIFTFAYIFKHCPISFFKSDYYTYCTHTRNNIQKYKIVFTKASCFLFAICAQIQYLVID